MPRRRPRRTYLSKSRRDEALLKHPQQKAPPAFKVSGGASQVRYTAWNWVAARGQWCAQFRRESLDDVRAERDAWDPRGRMHWVITKDTTHIDREVLDA
jgi:hypothetical protein